MKHSFSATIEAAHEGAIASYRPVDGVLVKGTDAKSFLQGQCSQDIDGLGIGESTEALLLSPQGKIDAFVRVIAESDESFVLICDGGQGSAVYERLRRFKIRVKITLEQESFEELWCLGPNARSMAEGVLRVVAGWVFPLNWSNLEGYGVVAKVIGLDASIDLGDEVAIETLRIAAGLPLMGQDLDETTIAEEAGLVERTVSFTKGCYTGQELVARLEARGSNVARRLRLIEVPEPIEATVGDELMGIDRVVGRLTSVSRGESGGLVALGYVARSIAVPGAVGLQHGDVVQGEVKVRALADR